MGSRPMAGQGLPCEASAFSDDGQEAPGWRSRPSLLPYNNLATPADSNESGRRFRQVAWQKLELALDAAHPRLDRARHLSCARRHRMSRVEADLCPNHCPSAEAPHGNGSAAFPVRYRRHCSGT